MLSKKLYLRYAQAFYNSIEKQGIVKASIEEIESVIAAYDSVERLHRCIGSPVYRPAEKEKILQALFAGKVSEYTLQFLIFIVRKKRGEDLYRILQEVIALHQEVMHIRTAYLTTAQGVSPELLAVVVTHIKKLTRDDNDVVLITKEDKSLLGGYILKIGDKQLDMSLRGQLERLQNYWETNPLTDNNPLAA